MNDATKGAGLARRREPHTVIIARGDKIRHFKVRTGVAAFCGAALVVLSAGYFLATSYLVFRDDIITASVTREAHIRQTYEERIAALRTQVDRIKSRQLLDQQVVEKKVGELLRRQAELTQRHGSMAPVVERAVEEEDTIPLPTPRPKKHAELGLSDIRGTSGAPAMTAYAQSLDDAVPNLPWPIRSASAPAAQAEPETLFASVGRSLERIEKEQIGRLDTLTQNAYQTADEITDALQTAGIKTESGDSDENATGGPYIGLDGRESFDTRVMELNEALDTLDGLKRTARSYPLRSPANGHVITSGFGVRSDPFLDTPGFHSGIDFREKYGTAIHATAAGTVVKAGWHGGYGRLVEIDHGNGLTSRYGHLSQVNVAIGQKIGAGTVIGLSGSSGRSTGPHLHYEIREDGRAVNPLRFIKAGRAIHHYL